MSAQWLVMAKAPVPGQVKTRLCPPCTPVQAARLAAAALADTLRTVGETDAAVRTLAVHGEHPAPGGWKVVPQRGSGLGARLANAFHDTGRPGMASLLVGMDTPQLTSALLTSAATMLRRPTVDAILGPARDGGWWLLGLREPAYAGVLRDVPMSTARTGADTLAALRGLGLRVALAPTLRDVDTAEDACEVAALCPPDSGFPRAVAEHLPTKALT